ncbi:GGDEF domain-containing protein [Candidatus Microgenomates bacterium]|nr:GGDEF domain-containing protein [Candidatus Microgenomates bacterium]
MSGIPRSPEDELIRRIRASDLNERQKGMIVHLVLKVLMYDRKTGLLNEYGLNREFNAIRPKVDNGTIPYVAIVYGDLDRFKQTQDKPGFGYAWGDLAIVKSAEVLKASVRPIDIVARVHGDEYVLGLLGGRDLSVVDVCDRVQRGISRLEIKRGDASGRITMTCGVANYPNDGQLDDLLHLSSERMKAIKRERKSSK